MAKRVCPVCGHLVELCSTGRGFKSHAVNGEPRRAFRRKGEAAYCRGSAYRIRADGVVMDTDEKPCPEGNAQARRGPNVEH